jgi:hypothetical protein
MYPMAQAIRVPTLEFSRPGANPTLSTIELIRAALRESEVPMSRNELLERLAVWGHSTSRQSLNAALKFLASDGSIAEGSKGLLWVPPASAKLQEIIRRGVRL